MQCLSQLRQVFHLNLNKVGAPGHSLCAGQHLRYSACGGNVVFLDQNGVVQANAVVGTATCANRIFLRQPQAGQRFSGVNNLRPRAAHPFYVNGGFAGHSAEHLQKIKRCAFCGQQRLRLTAQLQNHLACRAAFAVAHVPNQLRCGVKLKHGGVDPVAAANYGSFARQHNSLSA